MRAAQAPGCRVQSPAELGEVVGSAVRQGAIGLCPDVLGRVELGRVRGEFVNVQARVSRDENRDLPPPMDRAAIPEEHHGAAEMPKQMPEEGPDVEPREIPGLAA